MVGVQDLDVANRLDVTSGYGTWALLAHDHALGIVTIHLDGDFLDVEHDIRHIFPNAGDGGEFVQDTVDLHGRNSGAAQRRQQNATQRVAEGEAETTFQRLGNERCLGAAGRGELDLVRLDKFLPILLNHL
ncbi:hypothetical protein D3C86_1387820 [compost metagenome]